MRKQGQKLHANIFVIRSYVCDSSAHCSVKYHVMDDLYEILKTIYKPMTLL